MRRPRARRRGRRPTRPVDAAARRASSLAGRGLRRARARGSGGRPPGRAGRRLPVAADLRRHDRRLRAARHDRRGPGGQRSRGRRGPGLGRPAVAWPSTTWS